MADKGLAMVQRTSGGNQTLHKESVLKPKPAPHQLLVAVSHVAQNPTDVQAFDTNAFGDGSILGCDFVGTVEEAGNDTTRTKEGDVISGLIWGGEVKSLGAYSQYTLADDRINFKVPKSVSPEKAATVPLACCTAWLALFSRDCLNIDRKENGTSVLVWGGSSSVGQYAVQIAKHYGFNTIATCSPKNFDLVKKAGATHVFDYRDEGVIEKINGIAPDLKHVFDTIGNKTSSELASQAIHHEGGCLCTVRPGKANTENCTKQTKVTDVLVWTAFLKEHRYREFVWPANKEDHELAAELFEKLPKWLEDGTIKPNNVKLFKGLESVPDGFEEHREGKISAYKIVYAI